VRAPIVLVLCSTLAACSTSESLPPTQPYVPPSMMPTTHKQCDQVGCTEAHLTGPIEMSNLRLTDHGPGHFMLCIRGVSNDSRTGTYEVFFDNNSYMALRLPAILDACEKQNYRPIPVEPEKNAGPKPRAR
jgi:hypothetical protein